VQELRLGQRLRRLLHGDSILVFAFVILVTGYLNMSFKLRAGFLSDVVGPRNFPIILSVLGLGLAALFFIQKLARPFDAEAPADGRPTLAEEHRTLLPLGLTVAYALSLEPLGYVLATFLFSVLMLLLLGQRGWIVTVVFSLGLTAVSFTLFGTLFEVRLPVGHFLPRFN